MPAIEFMASTPIMSAVGDAAGAAGAAAMKAAQMVGTTQTKFSIDPAEASKLIKGLEDARRELERLHDEAMDVANVNSPGKDIYSGFATMAVRKATGAEEGGYCWANVKAQEALNETIKNIQDALNVYKETESGNKSTFKG
ncbi:hypothetical protein FKR81_08990 [Lentzea tibetensis]|uniref:PE domain-containing protein n=1 Tax=Lentzea tibetensis TaxID=2591470 RepID=A0A563EY38_9PSEU|nr:hypothetical protein [Lentzea tibetensis]TWP52458.1 hypothetical protein FKR81_08990 [Lentzea tibetensis]